MIVTIHCPSCGDSMVYSAVDELPMQPGGTLSVTCECGTKITVRFDFECEEPDE